jgi:hypothetical protein
MNTLAWNRYAYTLYNPVRYVDPSGHRFIPPEDTDPEIKREELLQQKIKDNFNFVFEGDWTLDEIEQIWWILFRISNLMGGYINFQLKYGCQTWVFKHHLGIHAGVASSSGYAELKTGFTNWTLAHELGHLLSFANDRAFEKGLQQAVGAGKGEWWKAPLRDILPEWKVFWYDPGSSPPVNGVDKNFDESEDFAESFAAVVLPEEAAKKGKKHNSIDDPYNWVMMNNGSFDFSTTPRGLYVLSVITN